MYLCSHRFLVHPQRIHRRFQCLQRKHSPPFLSCAPRNTCGLLSNLSRGTDNGCSVAPSMTSGSSNETPPIFFSSSSKPPSLANVLVVTGVVSIGFVSPALGIFSQPFSSAKVCSKSFFCPRVRSKVAMSSVWTNFKVSWESRLLFPSSSIVFCFSPWSLHHVLESKLVKIKKIELLCTLTT